MVPHCLGCKTCHLEPKDLTQNYSLEKRLWNFSPTNRILCNQLAKGLFVSYNMFVCVALRNKVELGNICSPLLEKQWEPVCKWCTCRSALGLRTWEQRSTWSHTGGVQARGKAGRSPRGIKSGTLVKDQLISQGLESCAKGSGESESRLGWKSTKKEKKL